MELVCQAVLSAGHGAVALGVIPVMVGPMTALIAALPAVGLAIVALIVAMFKPSTMKRVALLAWSQKLIMCILIVGVVCLCYGYSKLFGMQTTDSKAVGAGEGWSLFRGGSARTAFRGKDPLTGKTIADPAHGPINWDFSDGGIKTFYSSAAVVGNRVYVTGSDYSYFHDHGGIYSLDADTGKVVWAFHGDGYRSTISSPAVSGKYLVVGEGLHLVKDSRVFCLDVAQSEKEHKGVELWNFRTKSHMESSPCIDADRCFIGAGDDGVYCLQLAPEAPGNKKPKLLWRLPGKKEEALPDGKYYPDCESAPVVYGGKLYFGLGRKIHAMICADPKTGHEFWRVMTPYPTASPAIANDKMFFGMGIGDFINDADALKELKQKKMQQENKSSAEIAAAVKDIYDAGQVWCVDLDTHKVEWKFNIGKTILGTPAVDGDNVYVGARDGYLYCLSASSTSPDGTLEEKFNAHGPIVSSPAVGNKYVYVVTTPGMLYALDKHTLALAWSISLNNQSFSSPAVADGHVYVGTEGGFMSVGLPGRKKTPPLWAGDLGGPGRSGSVDGSQLASAGVYSWSYPATSGDSDSAPSFAALSPAAIIDTNFYMGVSRKNKDGVVYGVEAMAGEVPKGATYDPQDDNARITLALEKPPERVWLAASKYPVTRSPAATDDYVFFVDGHKGDAGRMLRCVDRHTGAVLWSHPVAADASGAFSISRGSLVIADTADGVTGLRVTGSEDYLWKQADGGGGTIDVGGCIGAPAVAADFFAIATRKGDLLVLDDGSGRVLWRQTLGSPARCGPVIFHDRVWVGTDSGVVAYNLLPGQATLPPIASDPVKGRLYCSVDHLAYMTQSGDLIVADAEPPPPPPKSTAGAGGSSAATTAASSAPAPMPVVRQIEHITGAIADVPPILGDDAIIYYAKNSIERYDLRTHKTSQWAKVTLDFPGTITTPMVMLNSYVFFATDDEGFVCYKPRKDQ